MSYLAKWEYSLLAQIDSCFFNLAKRKDGLKSKDCEKICEIFSTFIDKNLLDIEMLKDMYAKYSWEKTGDLSITASSELSIWDDMLKRQRKVFMDLKERKVLPTDKEWKAFQERIYYTEEKNVDQIIQSLGVHNCVHEKEIVNISNCWKRMWKGTKSNIKHHQVAKGSAYCSYDCNDKGCVNTHSEDPFYYNKHWKNRMSNELREVIKLKLDAFSVLKRKLISRTNFTKKGND